MVIGAFPAAKLGALLLKQVSKPVATVVKNQAKNSPVFRKYVCMPPAQFYNWCEIKAKMWILNLGKPVNIPVLSEAQAIELGANLLGEAIIFLIAAGILVNEYARSSAKESAKEEAKKQELQNLRSEIRDLYIQAEEERAQIRELIRKIGEQHTQLETLASKVGIKSNISTNQANNSDEPPPYSPVHDDPNLRQTANPGEIYQLSTIKYPENSSSVLLLRAVDEIGREFWNYPTMNREESHVLQGLYYLKYIFRL